MDAYSLVFNLTYNFCWMELKDVINPTELDTDVADVDFPGIYVCWKDVLIQKECTSSEVISGFGDRHQKSQCRINRLNTCLSTKAANPAPRM